MKNVVDAIVLIMLGALMGLFFAAVTIVGMVIAGGLA